MDFEPVIHSHGLSAEKHSAVLRLKNDELLSLERLALEVVFNTIVKGLFSERDILCLPPTFLELIRRRLNRHCIASPSTVLKLVKCCSANLDLTNTSHFAILCTTPILQALRGRQLKWLMLDNNTYITDSSLIHIKAIHSLTGLSLAKCSRLTNGLFRHLKDLTRLQSLTVSGIRKITNDGVSQLVGDPDNGPSLIHLDLSRTSIEDTNPNSNIFTILSRFTKLQNLNISRAKKVRDLKNIELLRALKLLNVSNNFLSNDAIEDRIGRLITLERLDMRGTTTDRVTSLSSVFALPLLKSFEISLAVVGVPFPQHLIQPRVQSVNLTTLSLAQNAWLDDDKLSRLLEPLPDLLELDVSLTNVSSGRLKEELDSLPSLQVLGLQGLALHDEDMVFLTSLGRLKRLNVSDTELTDRFITEGFLNTCQQLELVSLCRTNISDRGLSFIRLKRLTALWLDSCTITVDTALQLSKSACKELTYIAMRNLLPIAEEEEILPADVFEMAEPELEGG